MPLLEAVEAAPGGEPLQSVVAHGLQEPVAVVLADLVELDHRLGDQTGDNVEEVEQIDVVVGNDGLGRFEGELTREHRELLEDDLFGRLEQAV
jgi:hypothetical protein